MMEGEVSKSSQRRNDEIGSRVIKPKSCKPIGGIVSPECVGLRFKTEPEVIH